MCNTILRFSDLTGLYHYEGGLTTPGCAEIVEWLVLDKPLLIRQNGLVSISIIIITRNACERIASEMKYLFSSQL